MMTLAMGYQPVQVAGLSPDSNQALTLRGPIVLVKRIQAVEVDGEEPEVAGDLAHRKLGERLGRIHCTYPLQFVLRPKTASTLKT